MLSLKIKFSVEIKTKSTCFLIKVYTDNIFSENVKLCSMQSDEQYILIHVASFMIFLSGYPCQLRKFSKFFGNVVHGSEILCLPIRKFQPYSGRVLWGLIPVGGRRGSRICSTFLENLQNSRFSKSNDGNQFDYEFRL